MSCSLYADFWALHKRNGDQTKIIENYIEKYETKEFERSENAEAGAAIFEKDVRCHIEPDEPWPRPEQEKVPGLSIYGRYK